MMQDGMQSQVDQILAAFQPGEMVTASVIAKRCKISVSRAANYLAFMRDGGMLAWKLDPTNRQRWVYGLKQDAVSDAVAKLDALLEKILLVNIVIDQCARFAALHGQYFEIPSLDEEIQAAREAVQKLKNRESR